MSYYSKFLSLSRGKQIACIVFVCHFSAVFFLCAHHFFSKETPKQKMVVRTSFVPPSSASLPVAKSLPAKGGSAPAIVAPAKTVSPIKKKEKLKKPEISSDKTGKIAKALPTDLTLLQEIEKDLVLIERERSSFTGSSDLSLPKSLPDAPREEERSVRQGDYGEALACFLRSSLELPEWGEVVVDLFVDSSGRLVDFKILEAKSKKNGEFLKKRLPELILPCFNDSEKSYATRNFTITFKNAPGL